MKKVLITRQKDQAKALTKALKDNGFEVFVEPLFSVKKSLVKKISKKISAVILTSANACDAVIKSGISRDVKIFAVGKKTVEKLSQDGFKNIVFSPKKTATSLFELIIKAHKNKSQPILYFQGEITSFDFKKELKKFGLEVQNILAYGTLEKQNFSKKLQQFSLENHFDHVLIFSQNSAKIFFKLAKKHNLLEYFKASQILCLSEKILSEVRKSGFKNSATFGQFPILKNFYE
jgi:uroporphyrinogen-III synthase